jgi:hypothetical protein
VVTPSPSREPTPRERAPEPRALHRAPIALVTVFLVAAVYHALQSRGHVTPAIFADELLYSKLAQGIAAGEGFVVRDEPVYFPAPLAAIVQAPVWLLGDAASAYALAKVWNAVVMASAAFPAYWLARQLVRHSYALLAAAAAVAAPALVYHSYLLSEALAYPVFLLALATMTRALARPSPRWEAAVVAVSVLAVLTRSQFAVLPLAYLLAVPLVPRLSGERVRPALRRHARSAGALLGLAGLAFALGLRSGGSTLGVYAGALQLNVPLLEVIRWSLLTAVLLPFAAGWLVFPGAVLGLGSALARPRTRGEAALALLAAACLPLLLLQAGFIAALEAERPLERYTIYLAPLVFVAFFLYVERGAPRRSMYVALALALGVLAVLVPFPSIADESFSFDSPTLSAYGVLADRLTHADAVTIFAVLPLAGSLVLAFTGLRRRVGIALAAAAIALLVASGVAVYGGDHGMTERARTTWAASPPDWLERVDGEVAYLALPGGSPYFGWTLEAWSRNLGRPIDLDVERSRTDPFAASRAEIARDGRLLVDGVSPGPGAIVVNDYGSRIELDGASRRGELRQGLTAHWIAVAPHVRALAAGLYADGWAGPRFSYRVWPESSSASGVYRLELELPRGRAPRTVTVAVEGGARRVVALEPGERVAIELPVSGSPVPALSIESERFDYIDGKTLNPRFVAVKVSALAYSRR